MSNWINRELKQTDVAAVNRQISVQIQSDGCQGLTEFTWPGVVLNRNLQVGRQRVSLLKLPNKTETMQFSKAQSRLLLLGHFK